jgi:hypothetical protein
MRKDIKISSSSFTNISEDEALNLNGGAVIVPFLIGVGVGLVANEVVRRTTGKNIVQHAGDGIKTVGSSIKSFGEKLYN